MASSLWRLVSPPPYPPAPRSFRPSGAAAALPAIARWLSRRWSAAPRRRRDSSSGFGSADRPLRRSPPRPGSPSSPPPNAAASSCPTDRDRPRTTLLACRSVPGASRGDACCVGRRRAGEPGRGGDRRSGRSAEPNLEDLSTAVAEPPRVLAMAGSAAAAPDGREDLGAGGSGGATPAATSCSPRLQTSARRWTSQAWLPRQQRRAEGDGLDHADRRDARPPPTRSTTRSRQHHAHVAAGDAGRRAHAAHAGAGDRRVQRRRRLPWVGEALKTKDATQQSLMPRLTC